MFSFLRPWAFYFFQPPSLEDDHTGGPSRTVCPHTASDPSQPPSLKDDPTVCPSHTGSDPHHHEFPRPDLYPGPLDVTPADMPELFDILLNDVDEKVLHNEISTAFGSAYLSETPHLTSPHITVDGIMFGEHCRVLFPLVVRLPGKSRSYVIHFLYDSGSPFTFLSQEACDKLFGTNPVPPRFPIRINSNQFRVNPPNASSHFEHVNLLGADFCDSFRIDVTVSYGKRTATMHFPSESE